MFQQGKEQGKTSPNKINSLRNFLRTESSFGTFSTRQMYNVFHIE